MFNWLVFRCYTDRDILDHYFHKNEKSNKRYLNLFKNNLLDFYERNSREYIQKHFV